MRNLFSCLLLAVLVGPAVQSTNAAVLIYVVSNRQASVLKYDAETGDALGTVVPSGQGGLTSPGEIAVGGNGDLYVSSYTQNAIYRFDSNGTFKATLAGLTLSGPRGLAFGSDGMLYVSSA